MGGGLKTALIVAAWDREDKIMSSLKNHYQIICDYLGFQNQGMIIGTECGTVSMTERSSFMKEAYELGKSV